jgi:putative ABC transport system ATP-binding protein
MIQLELVNKSFPNGATPFHAVKSASFSIAEGEVVALSGPSGSGKSTMLSLIGGLFAPDDGKIVLDGINIAGLKAVDMDAVRARHIGIIFQRFNLIPVLSALENVEMALLQSAMSGAQRRADAAAWLGKVGLSQRAHVRAGLLSGGEQQRVAIARALVHQPKIVLADEPTANLDRANAKNFLELLTSINRATGTTLVIATHDPLVLSYVGRQINMEDGQCMH